MRVADQGRGGVLGLLGMARRLGWGVADQGVSSLSTLAVSLVVARELGADVLGGFALAFVTYTVVLNASRGLSTDPLLVRFSGPPSSAWRHAVSACAATALAVGTIGGFGCVVAGALLPAPLDVSFIVLGLGMPFLMLQDTWRFAFFAVGKGSRAFLIDLVWTTTLLASLCAAIWTGHASLETCVLLFVASAALSALFGLALIGVRPRPSTIGAWLHDHRDLVGRYLVENLAVGVSRQLRTFAIGAVAGLVAVGEVRAAEILMGPFLVVLMGISQVAVPEAAHVLARAPRRLGRFCLLIGCGQGAAAAAWGVLVIVLMSTRAGPALFGEVGWQVRELLPAVTVAVALGAVSTGATTGLRSLGDARRSLTAQLTVSLLYVTGSGLGAAMNGAVGASWGYAMATVVGCAVWWVLLRAGLADHEAALDAAVPAPGPPRGLGRAVRQS
jgi:O-antigen/teichoic acid export membrane protein